MFPLRYLILKYSAGNLFFCQDVTEHRVLIRPIIKEACPGLLVKQKIKRQQSMTYVELTLLPAAWTAFIDRMFEKMQQRGMRSTCTCKICRKRKWGPPGSTVSDMDVWHCLWLQGCMTVWTENTKAVVFCVAFLRSGIFLLLKIFSSWRRSWKT